MIFSLVAFIGWLLGMKNLILIAVVFDVLDLAFIMLLIMTKHNFPYGRKP